MGGDGGNLKHVVHKRVHLERHQPAHRKKFGYLEKHKDYVKRAKDFHKKETAIQKMHRKAAFKNQDEFAFSMLSHKVQDGRTRKKEKGKTSEEQRLAESQDARYVEFREQMDKKGAARRSENLHFLNADRPNKHTLFVDDDEMPETLPASASRGRGAGASAEEVVAKVLDTHPTLLGRKANRLRLSQLDKVKLKDTRVADAQTKLAYRELIHRQERAGKLGRVREELELRQHLRKKGKRMKVKQAEKGQPAQFKWTAERKR